MCLPCVHTTHNNRADWTVALRNHHLHCRPASRDQRLCHWYKWHATLVTLFLECPAMQPVRDCPPALFSPAKCTMQRCISRQHDMVGMAHYIMDCLDVLSALSDAPDDASTSSWRLDSCNSLTHCGRGVQGVPTARRHKCTLRTCWHVQRLHYSLVFVIFHYSSNFDPSADWDSQTINRIVTCICTCMTTSLPCQHSRVMLKLPTTTGKRAGTKAGHCQAPAAKPHNQKRPCPRINNLA